MVDGGRRETGLAVRDRLASNARARKADVAGVDLFLIRDFLDLDSCARLVALIDAQRSPSPLFADNPDPEFRTSETCNLDPADATVAAVDAALSDLTGLAPGLGERLQGQRYEASQQFKPHHDYLRTTAPYWARQSQIGGQRTWTAMIYLNRPDAGGETHFPRLDLTSPPRPGSLVVWNNMDATGEPNVLTLHQGCPVTAGLKHIVTKWYRERPWGFPAQNG